MSVYLYWQTAGQCGSMRVFLYRTAVFWISSELALFGCFSPLCVIWVMQQTGSINISAVWSSAVSPNITAVQHGGVFPCQRVFRWQQYGHVLSIRSWATSLKVHSWAVLFWSSGPLTADTHWLVISTISAVLMLLVPHIWRDKSKSGIQHWGCAEQHVWHCHTWATGSVMVNNTILWVEDHSL